MRIYGVSATRNGSIQVVNTEDLLGASGNLYPVTIPTTNGAWFTDVTTEQVDSTGTEFFEFQRNNPFHQYWNSKTLINYKYGYDPLWNVEDANTYTFTDKNNVVQTVSGGFKGTPRQATAQDVLTAKDDCLLQTRIIFIYNDSAQTLTNVKVRIEDQTLLGTVVELVDAPDIAPTVEWQTDGANYNPENVKYHYDFGLGNTTELDYVPQEITIASLGPAGTQSAWHVAYLNMYVTKESGNYAGVYNDYITLVTQSLV